MITEFLHEYEIGHIVKLKRDMYTAIVEITDVAYSKRLQKVTYSAKFISEKLQKCYSSFVDIPEEDLS